VSSEVELKVKTFLQLVSDICIYISPMIIRLISSNFTELISFIFCTSSITFSHEDDKLTTVIPVNFVTLYSLDYGRL